MSEVITNWKPELYNQKHSFVYNYGKSLIDLLDPQKGERILDLGCGSGQLTSQIHELADEVIGIDNSEEMIADAKSKFKEIEFRVASATNFQFDKKFDAIFSNAVLHWVRDYASAIRCMYNNLKSEGRIVLEFGGKGNVEAIVSQLRNSLKKRGYIRQSELELWYFPSIGEYAPLLEKEGFRVIFAQHYDRPTELADEKKGIKDWLSMFGVAFFEEVTEEDIEEIKDEVQQSIKPQCFKDGKWYADYKRIRIKAIKT